MSNIWSLCWTPPFYIRILKIMPFISPFSFFFLFILGLAHCYIQCLDNSGEVVDWYFVYKSNEGTNYSYFDASSTVEKLTPSTTQTLDAGSNSCIERTLNQIYSNKKDINYVAYNDEFPNGTWSATSGHTKGVLAFDNTNAFKGTKHTYIQIKHATKT